MDSILVSAIITTHNRSELLERAICSVQNQIYKDIELIVIDDASDTWHKKKNEVLAKNTIYHYISKEESKGGNYARNVGINISKGLLIAFLDDDDAWDPTKIEKQVAMYKSSHFDVIGCGRNRIFVKNGTTIYSLRDIPKGERGKDFSETIFMGPPFVTSELLITRDALINAGKFDETLKAWQEYDLLIRLSDKHIFGCVEEALVDYYVYLSSTNRLSNKLDIYIESASIVENKYEERISSLPPQLKKTWKKLILEECANRSSNKYEKKRYRRQIFLMEKNIRNFIFYIFNIDRSNSKLIRFIVDLRNSVFGRQ